MKILKPAQSKCPRKNREDCFTVPESGIAKRSKVINNRTARHVNNILFKKHNPWEYQVVSG